MAVPQAERHIRFGVFEVDLRTGEIRKHGRKIKLQEQPFQILQILLEQPGQVVTREELRQKIWPADTFVDFDHGLNNAIRRLREALSDSADNPRFIETVSRRGYRFIAMPTTTNGSGSILETSKRKDTQAARRWYLWGAVITFVAVLGVGALIVLYVSRTRDRIVATSLPRIQSLAVLPLANLSGDPTQDYFSDGMTDALITDLAQISTVKVISRTSVMHYKKTAKTLPEIARELNVDGIIEGTVQRSSDRLRITAQLIHAPSDKHLWANSYERDSRDILALERDVAQDITHEVEARLTTEKRARLAPPLPVNPKVLEAYLQGNFYLIRGEWAVSDVEKRKAAEYFQAAIDADPAFMLAYIGLSNSHFNLMRGSSEDLTIRKRSAEKALALDPNSAEALAILADIKWSNYLDWQGAEQEYRQAVKLNPNSVLAHDGLGTLLGAVGRLDEALTEVEIAQGLDPMEDHLSPILEMRGENARAIELLKRLVDTSPDNGVNHYGLYRNYAESGMYKEAVHELERACTLFGHPELSANMHRAFAASGYRGAMRESARAMEHLQTTKEWWVPENLAYAYLASGNKDLAFYWLEQAYEHRELTSHDWGVMILKVDPLLAPLRSDPRYEDLLHRMGLTQ